MRVKWYDNADQVGFPEAGLQHTLLDAPDSFAPVSIARPPGTLNRVAFWNVNNRMDELFAQQAMKRILQAVDPDILALSEVSNVSAAYVTGLLNDWLPLECNATWNVVKDDWDLMVASKGAILASFPSVMRQFPALVEGHPGWGVPLLITSSHLKCCGGSSNEAQRQAEADEYMAFLRDAMNGEGELALAPNSPVVYGGA